MSHLAKHNSALRAAAKKAGLGVVALLAMTTSVRACPMCKDSKVTDTGVKHTGIAEAGLNFNTSIYLLLGSLTGIAGFTTRVMYQAVCSSRQS